jgi:hypothetical protein
MIAALAGLVVACRVPWWACPQIMGALRATAIAAAVMTPGQTGRVRDVLMVSPSSQYLRHAGKPGNGMLPRRAGMPLKRR